MLHESIENCIPSQMDERGVQVVFEIVPKGSCFMDEVSGKIEDVALHFPKEECHADVTVSQVGDGGVTQVDVFNYAGDICENCPGTIFSDYDLVPRFLERSREKFIVQTHVPADQELSALVADLRTVSERVTVLRIVDMRESELGGVTGEVDFSKLTEKQHEAIEGAVNAGYYGLSQDVSLAELAAEFDISTSALSQRLARAERNVLAQLFESE